METRTMRLVPILCALLFAVPAVAQAQNVQPGGYGSPIELVDALALIQRGMQQSADKGLKMVFAVVEPSGELVAFARMDDVPYASIQLAQQKARTSARLRIATAEMERRVQGGRVTLLSSEEVIAIGGGVPIIANGRVIGALGVSGGTAAEDDAVAVATIATR